MSPFIVLPVVAGVLWLVHAGLGTAGHRAYRFSGRILFTGLAAAAVVFVLLGIQANISVLPEWKNDSLGGVVEFILALETVLVLLILAMVEVIRVAVTQTIVQPRGKAAAQRPDPANSLSRGGKPGVATSQPEK